MMIILGVGDIFSSMFDQGGVTCGIPGSECVLIRTIQEKYAFTNVRYLFVNTSKEVIFFNTLTDNPNNDRVKGVFLSAGYTQSEDSLGVSQDTVQDVWCNISVLAESSLLRIKCYAEPNMMGDSFERHADYNVSIGGYNGISKEVDTLRETVRKEISMGTFSKL
jgi:hypothetical protein